MSYDHCLSSDSCDSFESTFSSSSCNDNSSIASRDHIQLRLRANLLINNANEDILKQSVNDALIQSFGGYKSFMFVLTKYSEIQQIQSIYDVIKEEQTKYDQLQQSKPIPMQVTNHFICTEYKQQSQQSAFSLLPDECIGNICGYLDQRNIKSFKQTSRQIAIICLQEMDKISVRTITISNLAVFSKYIRIFKSLSYSRYHPKIRYFSLYQAWYTKYNIPHQNQLIFIINATLQCGKKAVITKLKLIDSQNNRLENVYIPRLHSYEYLICDNRNMIILNQAEARKFNAKYDTFQTLQNYRLLMLKYFDTIKQIYPEDANQFILYSEEVTVNTLIHYIQHQFIPIDNKNNIWYQDFKKDLKTNSQQSIPSKIIKMFKYTLFQQKEIEHNEMNLQIAKHEVLLFSFELNDKQI